jgi:putative transposase
MAPALVKALPAARLCVADAAYDSDAFRQLLLARGTLPDVPNSPTGKRRHPFDPLAYRLRNLIERAFCRLKDWRRIATRYISSPPTTPPPSAAPSSSLGGSE